MIISSTDRADFYQTFFPSIKSGAALTITHGGSSGSSLINGSTVTQNIAASEITGEIEIESDKDTSFNSVNITTLLTSGAIEIDLSAIDDELSSDSTTSYSGLYKINKTYSSATPLIESRSPFTDLSKFFGSDYFYDILGVSKADVLAAATLSARLTSGM